MLKKVPFVDIGYEKLYRRFFHPYRQVSRKKLFTNFYEQNKWADSESISGPGSNLRSTESIRQNLPSLLMEVDAKSILDIPCGDFYWMNMVQLEINQYIGADIVPELIQNNQKKYSDANHSFKVLDIITDRLPQVDVVLCRDVFIHFCYKDIRKSIRQIKKSQSKYLLVTNCPQVESNINIITGQYRQLNFEKPPFNFPKPIKSIDDIVWDKREVKRQLALFAVSDI